MYKTVRKMLNFSVPTSFELSRLEEEIKALATFYPDTGFEFSLDLVSVFKYLDLKGRVDHFPFEVNRIKDPIFYQNYLNTGIIVANGPSLNDVHESLIKMFPYVLMNRGYLKDELSQDFYVYVAVNDLVLRQFKNEIESLYKRSRGGMFFLPDWFDTSIFRYLLRFTPDVPSFQKAPMRPIWQGHTVTYVALQIMYWFGFRKVIIVGLDHHYPDADGKPTNMEEKLLEDNSHFSKEYFKGKYWHTPNLKKSEEAYKLALHYYKQDKREIVNATPKSKLRVFPKMGILEALR